MYKQGLEHQREIQHKLDNQKESNNYSQKKRDTVENRKTRKIKTTDNHF